MDAPFGPSSRRRRYDDWVPPRWSRYGTRQEIPSFLLLPDRETWKYISGEEKEETPWASPHVAVWNTTFCTYRAGLLPSNPGLPILLYPMPYRLDYILNMPPASYECQLEHAWNDRDKSRNIRVLEDDKLTFFRRQALQSTDCIRGKVGFTKGLHVWEIYWPVEQRGTNAVVGVATENAPLDASAYQNLVGNNNHSWGWDLVQKRLYHGHFNEFGKPYPVLMYPEATFNIPDKFLVVLDMDSGTVSYVVDNKFLGVAFFDLCGYKLYPIVSAVWGKCQVTMKYIGNLDTKPLPLMGLCRRAIRNKMGNHNLEERVLQLKLPRLLKNYILNKEGI